MNLKNFSLKGKNALITGGAGLLGIQHASAILEAEGNVVLTDIRKKDLNSALKILSQSFDKNNIYISEMDVTDETSIKTTLNKLAGDGMRIDILINNAAIDPKVNTNNNILESSRLENFDLEQWNMQISVGLTGAFLCSKYFGNAMTQDQKGGVILNISSDLSVISPDQRLYKIDGLPDNQQPVKPITYSVIKTGLIGLTRYLATYWADKGIRCNALSPGGVYNEQNEEFVNNLKKLIPLERMANANEYKSSIQFLCSDASAYMNGQNLVIDGGRSIL